MIRRSLKLGAVALLCVAAAACKDDDDFLIDDERFAFEATLTAINDTISILDPSTEGVSGVASFEVDVGSDRLTAVVAAEGLAPSIVHLQNVFDEGSCPSAAADVNEDGFIDVVEGAASFGRVLIPLDSDLSTRAAGNTLFPSANSRGEIDYEESADLQSVLDDLGVVVTEGDTLELSRRTVILHGVDSTEVTLPPTVATLPGFSPYATLPVGCGVILEND